MPSATNYQRVCSNIIQVQLTVRKKSLIKGDLFTKFNELWTLKNSSKFENKKFF